MLIFLILYMMYWYYYSIDIFCYANSPDNSCESQTMQYIVIVSLQLFMTRVSLQLLDILCFLFYNYIAVIAILLFCL